jgi:hypothetical protein
MAPSHAVAGASLACQQPLQSAGAAGKDLDRLTNPCGTDPGHMKNSIARSDRKRRAFMFTTTVSGAFSAKVVTTFAVRKRDNSIT